MKAECWYMLVTIRYLRVNFVVGKYPWLRLVTPHEDDRSMRLSAEGFTVLVG